MPSKRSVPCDFGKSAMDAGEDAQDRHMWRRVAVGGAWRAASPLSPDLSGRCGCGAQGAGQGTGSSRPVRRGVTGGAEWCRPAVRRRRHRQDRPAGPRGLGGRRPAGPAGGRSGGGVGVPLRGAAPRTPAVPGRPQGGPGTARDPGRGAAGGVRTDRRPARRPLPGRTRDTHPARGDREAAAPADLRRRRAVARRGVPGSARLRRAARARGGRRAAVRRAHGVRGARRTHAHRGSRGWRTVSPWNCCGRSSPAGSTTGWRRGSWPPRPAIRSP